MFVNQSLRKLTLIALSFILTACSAVSNLIATETPTPLPPTPTSTATIVLTPTRTPKPTATITLTPFYDVLGARSAVTIDAAGFKFLPVKGYDVDDNNGGASMQSEDEMVTAYFEAYKAPRGVHIEISIKLVVKNLEERYKNVTVTDPLEGKTDGAPYISIDFVGEENHDPIAGRVTIYQPIGGKMIYLTVLANGDQRWEREGQSVYDQLADNISFFFITPWRACPINANGGYGYSLGSPIRIGGGLGAGSFLTRNYLDALLGPEGELVEYYHEGTADFGGQTYDEYTILYGSTFKTLYFDIYNYERPFAPSGLQCSAPLG